MVSVDSDARVLYVGPESGAIWEAFTATTEGTERVRVHTVETTDAALETLADERVDCLVDGRIDEEGRIQFLSTVGEETPEVPSLFVTDDPALADDALAAGGTEVLLRHDDIDAGRLLERRLDRLLGREARQTREQRLVAERDATDQLLDTIDDIFYLLDGEGNLQRWNETFNRVTGYTDEEIAEMHALEFFPEEQQSRITEAIQEALETGSTTVEAEMATKDGDRVPVEYTGARVLDGGEVGGVVGMGRDITERKKRERELRLAETVFEETQDAVFVVDVTDDRGFQILRINSAYEAATGIDADEAEGQTPMDIVGEERGREIEAHYRECVEREESIAYEEELPIDGQRRVWRTNVAPVVEDGSVTRLVGATRDITERKERIEKLDQLQRHLSDVVWMSDPQKGSMDFISDSYEDVWGRPPETLKAEPQSFVEAIHPDDRERVEDALADQQEHPDDYEETYRVVQPDGEVRWVHDRSSGIYENGTLTHIVGIASDVTERKEREEELAYRTALLEAISETTVDGLLVVDEEGDVLYHNERFREMWDIPSEVAATGSDDDLLAAVDDLLIDPEQYREKVDYLYANPEEESHETIRLSDGRWFDRYSAPVVDDGTHHGRLWVFRDVTERKERERELELKNRAMDEAPIGITIHDASGEGGPITYANDGFVQLTGYGHDAVDEETFDLFTGAETDDTQLAKLRRAIDDGTGVSVVLLLYRKDGRPFWAKVSLAPVTDRTGDVAHFVGFLQDVTEMKEQEQEIARRLDEFGEVLAEDLQMPLQRATEILQTARDSGDETDIERAMESIERVDKLIDDLTTVHAQSVTSRHTFEQAPFDIEDDV